MKEGNTLSLMAQTQGVYGIDCGMDQLNLSQTESDPGQSEQCSEAVVEIEVTSAHDKVPVKLSRKFEKNLSRSKHTQMNIPTCAKMSTHWSYVNGLLPN